jgi:hypothetical protein
MRKSQKEYLKNYFQENKEAIYKKQKEWKSKNMAKVRKYQRDYAKRNGEYIKKKNKEYYHNNKDKFREYKKNDIEKRRIRDKTKYYIKTGKIKRECCAVCGLKKAEVHHINYEDAFNIVWLCKKHHFELHRKYD